VIGRPFLRIAEHELDGWPYAEWRGWFVECRRPDGTVIDTHPGPLQGLHGTQRMAFRAALEHLERGGCPDDKGRA
jgi:hypothetical protein